MQQHCSTADFSTMIFYFEQKGFLYNICFGSPLQKQFIVSVATICAVGQIFNLGKQIISCREEAVVGGGRERGGQ